MLLGQLIVQPEAQGHDVGGEGAQGQEASGFAARAAGDALVGGVPLGRGGWVEEGRGVLYAVVGAAACAARGGFQERDAVRVWLVGRVAGQKVGRAAADDAAADDGDVFSCLLGHGGSCAREIWRGLEQMSSLADDGGIHQSFMRLPGRPDGLRENMMGSRGNRRGIAMLVDVDLGLRRLNFSGTSDLIRACITYLYEKGTPRYIDEDSTCV